MSVAGLVARREIVERLRTRSFPVLTGLLVVIILAVGIITRLVGDDDPSTLEVGVVGVGPAVAEQLEHSLTAVADAVDRPATVEPRPDARAGRAALEDGQLDVLVDGDAGRLVFAGSPDDQTVVIVQQAWADAEQRRALRADGLVDEEISGALEVAPLTVTSLDGGDDLTGLEVLVGTVSAVLLFIALQTFGTYVLMGVVEEKATAVVEVLLVRVRARQLLAGKLIGIGVVAMIQLAAAVTAAIAALAISGAGVPSSIWTAVPMTLVWFLGGYAFYSTLLAVAGSLVSRQEDAQSAAAPISSVLVLAYVLVYVFGYVPASTASRVLSVLPPTAPFLMPMRMAAGAASIVEIVTAVVLLVLGTWAMWRLSSKVYEQVLLRRGTRIHWREALALARR
jgi:ABC-2 type transport system permease protein